MERQVTDVVPPDTDSGRLLEQVIWTLVSLSVVLFGLLVGVVVWGYLQFSAWPILGG